MNYKVALLLTTFNLLPLYSATESGVDTKRRISDVESTTSSIQKKYGLQGLATFMKARKKLKDVNSDLELSFQEKSEELIVLNSQKIRNFAIQTALNLSEGTYWKLRLKGELPTGEKTLEFLQRTEESLSVSFDISDLGFMGGKEVDKNGHVIDGNIFEPFPKRCWLE